MRRRSHDFVGNNFQTASRTSTYSGGLSEVWIQKGGSITGDLVANVQARYILLAGGNVVNEGNLFGEQVDIAAGLIASPGKATVNGVPGTVVNRLFSTEGIAAVGWPTFPTFGGFSTVDGNLGTANPTHLARPGTRPVRRQQRGRRLRHGGQSRQYHVEGLQFVGISAANGIRSGTLGDAQPAGRHQLGWAARTQHVHRHRQDRALQRGLAATPSTRSLPFLNINQSVGAEGDVIINALTPASQPSSITTTGAVIIAGGDVTIGSTINHLAQLRRWQADTSI